MIGSKFKIQRPDLYIIMSYLLLFTKKLLTVANTNHFYFECYDSTFSIQMPGQVFL